MTNPHNFFIDDAKAPDIPTLVTLLAELFCIEQDFQANFEKQTKGLSLLLLQPERNVIKVARTFEGKVIGMVSAQLVISTAEGAYSAWIEDMVVDAQFRAKGVGRQLLDAILDWAKSKGATRAQLLVDLDNNDAKGYYAHLGWATTRMGMRRKFIA